VSHIIWQDSFAPLPLDGDSMALQNSLKAAAPAFALLAPLVLGAGEAAAKGGEYGILEGRTFAFIHPTVMGA
jgi:hypothetical protein